MLAIKLHKKGIALSREERIKEDENLTIIENSINGFQTQVDNLVVQGDSSVEAAQARVPVEGTAYSTLKERLDTEHGEVTAQLAETTENVNLRVDNLVIPISPENSNVQVTDALVSTEKNKTFPTIRNRFEEGERDFKALEAVSAIALYNAINGKGDSLTGWTSNALSTVDPGYFEFRTNITTLPFYSMPVVAGHKYYLSLNYYTDGTVPTSEARLALRDVNVDVSNRVSLLGSVMTPTKISAVLTTTATGGRLAFYRLGSGGVYRFNNVLLINLTTAFGAGNEPSKEAMDSFVQKFPQAFFNTKKYFPIKSSSAESPMNNLQNDIKGTNQLMEFNSENAPSKIIHVDKVTSGTLRTDIFTYTSDLITEVRTLSTGEALTFKYNLITFETEVI